MSSSLPTQPEFLGSLGALSGPAGQVGPRVTAPASPYPLLDSLAAPQQVRHFTLAQLEQLATEVRAFLITSVSETGGHFSSNLGRTVGLYVAPVRRLSRICCIRAGQALPLSGVKLSCSDSINGNGSVSPRI